MSKLISDLTKAASTRSLFAISVPNTCARPAGRTGGRGVPPDGRAGSRKPDSRGARSPVGGGPFPTPKAKLAARSASPRSDGPRQVARPSVAPPPLSGGREAGARGRGPRPSPPLRQGAHGGRSPPPAPRAPAQAAAGHVMRTRRRLIPGAAAGQARVRGAERAGAERACAAASGLRPAADRGPKAVPAQDLVGPPQPLRRKAWRVGAVVTPERGRDRWTLPRGARVTGRKAGPPLLPPPVLEVAFEPAGLHRQPGLRSGGSEPLTCLRAVTGAAGQQGHSTA